MTNKPPHSPSDLPNDEPPGSGPPDAGGGSDSDGEELLIELAASSYRLVRADGTRAESPAWHDLTAGGRRRAFDRAQWLRQVEAAVDEEGLSATGRLVLDRIRRPKG